MNSKEAGRKSIGQKAKEKAFRKVMSQERLRDNRTEASFFFPPHCHVSHYLFTYIFSVPK